MPLADDDPEKWKCAVHTKVKHKILEKYLQGWLRKISKFRKICYFDCFAGRGRYTKGELGSPLIALKIAAENSHLYEKFIFTVIEKNKNNYENLKKEIENVISEDPSKYEKSNTDNMVNNEFKNVASYILKKVPKIAPSFFFIDPFGFSGVPFDVIKRIMEYKHTEVFITLMTRDINRFLVDASKKGVLNELYGTNRWKEIARIEDPDIRESKLIKLYKNQLSEVAKVKYVRVYKVRMDEKRRTAYYLIHATNVFDGFKLMTDIMFRESPSHGMFAYLGPEEGQMRLCDFSKNNKKLEIFILERFAGKSLTFNKLLRDLYSIRSDCVEKHYRAALKDLENGGQIKIKRVTSKKRGLAGDDTLFFPKKQS